jgi:hypothetical protein
LLLLFLFLPLPGPSCLMETESDRLDIQPRTKYGRRPAECRLAISHQPILHILTNK